MDNLPLGAYVHKERECSASAVGEVMKLFPRLEVRAWQPTASFSSGQQQLAGARALMLRQVLILNEPSLGLAPLVVAALLDAPELIRDVTILLVEQNAALALELIDAGVVIEKGKVLYEGDNNGLKTTELIRAAYLGGA